MARLRERSVFADQRLTVIAVESLEFETSRANRGGFMTGRLKPIAVIVKEPDRTYALDMDAGPVDIDEVGIAAFVSGLETTTSNEGD